MALNFNTSPYYDDFDPNKNFHRILFKPGYAVQARELTQTQTILQDQISKFASHVFQKNTPISGGKLTYNTNCFYVKLNPTINGGIVDVTDFEGALVQNAAGDVTAQVIATAAATGGDPNTLIVSYLSGQQFQNNDVIYNSGNANITAQAILTDATGKSSVASISEGVFYVVNGFNTSQTTHTNYTIGHFVSVQPQTTILSKYDSTPDVRVGLDIVESIYDYVNDTSLLDPADGAPNFQAPGADRYVISLSLQTRPLQLGDDDNFIELMRIENGQILKQVDGTVYATIDEYFAKRTYDTNGDYIVNDFKLTPTANTANNDLYDMKVGKGVAYVRGYRIENQGDVTITSERARTTDTITNNSTFIEYGNYLYVDGANNVFDVGQMQSIDLHVTEKGNISTTNTTTYNATLAATALIRNLEFDYYTDSANSATYVYKAYVSEIENKTVTGNVVSATSTTITLPGLTTSASANAYYGVTVSIDNGTSAGDVKRIVSYNGSTRTATVDSAFTITPDTTSVFTLRFDIKDVEGLVRVSSGTTIAAWAKINATTGKLNGISTGDTILQNKVAPELIYNLGYPYAAGITDASYQTTQVLRDVYFTGSNPAVTPTLNFPDTSNMQWMGTSDSNYIVINQATGEIMTAANTSFSLSNGNKSLVASVANASAFTATIIAKASITDATQTGHFLKIKNLKTANTTGVNLSGTSINSNIKVSLPNGQTYIKYAAVVTPGQAQSLYVSDVKRIVKIIDTLSSAAAPTSAMLTNATYDVTQNYSFDNGQKDSYYGHASIKLRPGRPKAKGDLLVLFDYYEHTGGDGYFSIESYLAPTSTSAENYGEIPTYTAKNGTVYNLRDSLDFRPTVKNAQASFVFDYTTDPSSSDACVYIPVNSSIFTEDYEYYLARKDKLVLSKDKNFEIIKGTPSVNPILPVEPDGALVIANLSLDPYTNYLPGQNPSTSMPNLSTERVQHRRWTMQDITGLQTRINNIEYYTALNTLEKDAQGLQVPDVNGLNRFKHGILVDDFSSFATADTYNYDFDAAINRREKKLTASHTVDNFSLQSSILNGTLNKLDPADIKSANFAVSTIGGTNIFTLPYTSANLAQQVLASNTINLNPFATPIIQGVLNMNPPMDNWVDNTKQPDLLIVDPDLQLYQQSDKLNTLNVSDWNVIPGTSVASTTKSQSGRTVTVTTQTFADLKQATTLGYYDKLGSSYSQTNGFLTDISVLPYIRSQKLLIKAQGLLTNTPVSAYFDGVNVNNNINVPDVIELESVSGTFKPDDVVGYYSAEDSNFYPIATVVDAYYYPNSSRVRLSIAGNYHSGYSANDNRIAYIQNATFNTNGTYKTYSANGKITTADTVAVHKTGQISMVGGDFTDVNLNNIKYYKVKFTRYSKFSQKYGIWGSPKGTGNLPTGKFEFSVPSANTYYVRCGFEKGEAQTYTLKVNNNSLSFTNTYDQDFSVTLPAGTANVEFGITSNSGSDGDQHFAFAISTQPWDAYTTQRTAPSTTKGTVIFSTDTLWSSVPTGVVSMNDLPYGGLYFTGVTQISLGGQASANDNFYTGSTMKVTSTYMSVNAVTNANVKQTVTQTANVINYIGANTTVFLDAPVNVSYGSNPAAGGDITSTYSLDGQFKSYKLGVSGGGLSKLSTDDAGNFVGVFTIPEGTFKTGERVLRIDNRTTPNDSGSATTFAEATFTASGLATKSQALEFSPSIDAAKYSFVQNSYQSKQLMSTTSYSYKVDPVAQTFIIDKSNYPNGVFLNSVKLFFYSKDTVNNTPVTISIVGTDNGYPNGSTLDHSIVTVYPNNIKTSNSPHHLDPNTYTEFVFPAPVYIQSDVMYAFIVRSPSTAYNIYFAGQRGEAIPSTVKNLPTDVTPTVVTKIGTMPYIGSLFESQNGITWTADQGKALMFKLERCKFDIAAQPKLSFAVPQNLPYRKLVTQGVESYYDADNIINHTGAFAGTDTESHSYNITTTDFVPTATSIGYTYKSLYKSNKAYTPETKVTPGKYGCPTNDNLYLNDGAGERILVSNSNSSFILYSTLSSTNDALSPMIADDALSLFNVRWSINNLELSNNTVTVTDGGTGYNANAIYVTVSAPDGSNGVQAIASANVIGGVLQSVYFTNTGSGYTQTPTITINDSVTRAGNSNAAIIVHGETSSGGGNGVAKYFTKRVVLTPGNDSGDLRVYYTAYRPYGTDINVYYKILNRNDNQPFEDGNWQIMTPVSNGLTYSQNRNDLYEYEAAPGINNVANNFVSYTSTSGQTYTQFAQFAIKVVMSTSDKTNVPFLTDIRALALPPGTGV